MPKRRNARSTTALAVLDEHSPEGIAARRPHVHVVVPVVHPPPPSGSPPLPKSPPPTPNAVERAQAEAVMCASIERLGADSPLALLVCDPYLARDFWLLYAHQNHECVASAVWTWGKGDEGQLGLADTHNHVTPQAVATFHDRRIHAAACGGYHTAVVLDDGELWTAGSNSCGQRGAETVTASRSATFTRVPLCDGRRARDVACAGDATLVLLDTGRLVAFGTNRDGILGVGITPYETFVPLPVADLDNVSIEAVACGYSHAMAVSSTGALYAWGENGSMQLGVADDERPRYTPKRVLLPDTVRVASVSCGSYHTAAVTRDGRLYTWGRGYDGALGRPVPPGRSGGCHLPGAVDALRGQPVRQVACGLYHTLAVLVSGGVYAWGCDDCGQLGVIDDECRRITDRALGAVFRVDYPCPVVFFSDPALHAVSVVAKGRTSCAILGASWKWRKMDAGLTLTHIVRSFPFPPPKKTQTPEPCTCGETLATTGCAAGTSPICPRPH